MKEYKENGSVIEITLDTDKVVKVSTKYIDNMVDKLDIDKEDALLTWLEDEGYLENEEQEELCKVSKENKFKMVATSEKPKAKTPKERVQKENETIKEQIIVALKEINKPVTVDELRASNVDMGTFSNQKLSALLKQLVDTNVVVKTVDKKKSYFSI